MPSTIQKTLHAGTLECQNLIEHMAETQLLARETLVDMRDNPTHSQKSVPHGKRCTNHAQYETMRSTIQKTLHAGTSERQNMIEHTVRTQLLANHWFTCTTTDARNSAPN